MQEPEYRYTMNGYVFFYMMLALTLLTPFSQTKVLVIKNVNFRTPRESHKVTMSTAKKKDSALQQLVAGGCAGLVESSICHPLVSFSF